MSMSLSQPADVTPIESSKPAISWGPIFGGAITAIGITLILLLLGSGFGLTMVSPWSGESSSATTIGVTAAIWLVVVQWLSSALGGYLTGRLRTKWAAIHTDEVFFRDTAHGFMSWALATIIVLGFLASSLTSLAGASARAVGSATSTASMAATQTAASSTSGENSSTSYFTDALLRPEQASAQARSDDGAATAEVSRILIHGAASGGVPDADKTYIAGIVSARTGLNEADARARVDNVLNQINDAKQKAQQAADAARKVAATTAIIGAISLLVGAFISSVAAALGGKQRDDEEDLFVTGRAPRV
ncbi:hypothetical protein [Oryzifoliimicrobium ureilyticus]|uniref:hypothetical protein n=1 Tax=Oryzifoliimicrobium ureilyticus TaxID=3113724 RepID=UPI0030763B03